MGKIIRNLTILTILAMMISCGNTRRPLQNGFGASDANQNVLGANRHKTSGDIGNNCPITDFVTATGAPLMSDVFWPFEFDVMNIHADGNGYFIMYDDLAMLGIGGVNPCNLLQVEYGIDGTGAATGTGYYDFFVNGNSGINDDCRSHIQNTARVAMITEDFNFQNSCSVFF